MKRAAHSEDLKLYESVGVQLAKGSSPEEVEADLIRSGCDAEKARQIVARMAQDLVKNVKNQFTWQLYTSIGVFAVAFLVAVGLGFYLLGKDLDPKRFLPRIWILSILVMVGQVFWVGISVYRIWWARRLDRTREAWLQTGGIPSVVAADAPPAAPPPAAMTDNPFALPPAAARPAPSIRRSTPAVGRQRGLRVEYLVVGGVGCLFLCAGFGAPITAYFLFQSYSERWRDRANVSSSPPRQQADPNAPDPDEGPPPRGWRVLFRSDDPAVWNTDSPGKDFARPVRRAHSKIRYLRLTRLDTNEALIVPITHKQLTGDERPDNSAGHWWNGTARQDRGARRLGIAQVPSVNGAEAGYIGVGLIGDVAYPGSGFGWKTLANDRQYYCWQGREIPRTTFEVAVKAAPLTDDEKRRFTGPEPEEGPPPPGWTVLFRSDDPSDWNTFRTGDHFAVPVGRAHSKTRYLRLTRLDTGEALILPVTRRDLAREPDPPPEKGFAWCGSARLHDGGRHLGILKAPRERFPHVPRERVSIMNVGWDGYLGSGFGHLTHVNKGQCCSWQGQNIPATVFEIAVTAGTLSEDEKRRLLK